MLLDLSSFMLGLLHCSHYVAKSEYLSVIPRYSDTVRSFEILQSGDMLDEYCRKNRLNVQFVAETCDAYNRFEELVDQHNDLFLAQKMVEEKDYLDSILKPCDPAILLDDDQRRVVLSDEDYTLVIAGAGAGKTTTVAAKVKYLVERQGVDPKKILVVSFTNKAVNELKQRIAGQLHIDCPIATFHSTGNAIIRKQNPEKLNIVDDARCYYVIQDYFRNRILKNESAVNNLILFFASYFDAPYEGKDLNAFFNNLAKSNYTTMRSELEEFREEVIDIRRGRQETIQSERMRSIQEVEVANYLYLNGIDYEYEPLYQFDILLSRKPYTPDFRIWQGDKVAYIEHFGITEDGRNNRYSSDELDAYKKAIKDKVRLHKEHGTTLLWTFSSYNDGRPITEHLRERLERAGFELRPRSNREIMVKLITTEENKYIRRLVDLLARFIRNFKVNGYSEQDFSRMWHSTTNARTRLFLDIAHDCYLEYQHYLSENGAVDFEDMINESARLLGEVAEMKQKLDFAYIIVDEYQDISRQRFDLVSALHKVTDAKIIAVGDDWQSIYAFSGSDITLFTHFKEMMGYAKELKIVRTYRNAQEVIDIAGGFIQKNSSQIQKALISNKHITLPVIIFTYNTQEKRPGDDRFSGRNFAMAASVQGALEEIIKYNNAAGKPKDSPILLLGRFNFDGDHLEKSGLFEFQTKSGKLRCVKYPWLNITFMTAHSSKGLGYDNVIIVNGMNDTYGFPSKIEDDPVLGFVVKNDKSIDYAEERRLFYVAMTRTKNRVFCIAPKDKPSEFLLELKRDYPNVDLRGEWNTEPPASKVKQCPVCGYPLQFRYKRAYGLRLHICTNEPEVCGFMTNEIKAGTLSIVKCDQCRDGYLIVKPGKQSDYFLGCTNYKKDGTGCKRTIDRQTFNRMMGCGESTLSPSTNAVSVASVMDYSVVNPKTDSHEVEVTSPELEQSDIGVYPEIHEAYLGEKAVKYRECDLNLFCYTIISCLVHISERNYYGVAMLTDVLRGATTDRIAKRGLNQVPEFGAMGGVERDDIIAMVYWLIGNGFIVQTKEQYPVLHPSADGLRYDETMTATKLKKLKKYLENWEPRHSGNGPGKGGEPQKAASSESSSVT